MTWILAAIMLWSTIGLVIRFSGVPVETLIFASTLISALLLAFGFIPKNRRGLIPRGRKLAGLLVVGPVSLINTFSFYYAYQETTVANAVLTHYTAPVAVALFAPVFLKERTTPMIAAAVVLASVGLWIMLGIAPDSFFSLLLAGDRSTIGILSGLVSGIAYAALVILLRKFASNHDPVAITVIQNGTACLLLMPFVSVPADALSAVWAFAIMSLVHSTLAPLLYLRGMRDVTASTAAILGYLEPVCVILLGIAFLGEPVTLATVAGGSLIMLSGYLTLRQGDK